MHARPAVEGMASERDRYVDTLRTLSLVIVVIWHWAFTVITWHVDGPHMSNPIGTTRGLWLITWFGQVMPLFFLCGGVANAASWQRARERGAMAFIRRRLQRLLIPTGAFLALAVVARLAMIPLPDSNRWANRLVIEAASPLWFLIIYVALVGLVPVTYRMYERLGFGSLLLFVGGAVLVDVARFTTDTDAIGWLNLVIVWALCHQLGYAWNRFIAIPRAAALGLAGVGLSALIVLTNTGPYPRSMVGVPAEWLSNVGPPTVCIVALAFFQLGLALLGRDAARRWQARPRPTFALDWLGARAITIFVWHFSAFLAVYGLLRAIGFDVPSRTNSDWWLQRPLWLLSPALVTAPLVAIFQRVESATS